MRKLPIYVNYCLHIRRFFAFLNRYALYFFALKMIDNKLFLENGGIFGSGIFTKKMRMGLCKMREKMCFFEKIVKIHLKAAAL